MLLGWEVVGKPGSQSSLGGAVLTTPLAGVGGSSLEATPEVGKFWGRLVFSGTDWRRKLGGTLSALCLLYMARRRQKHTHTLEYTSSAKIVQKIVFFFFQKRAPAPLKNSFRAPFEENPFETAPMTT